MEETIAIPKSEYIELKRKAEAYDKIKNNNSEAGKKTWANVSPAERSARAKKAVTARIAKYGQKTKKP